MKKVLITGANGFVGSALRKALSGQYAVIELTRIFNNASDSLIECDLLRLVDVWHTAEKLRGQSIDVIIHTASRMATSDNLDDINILVDNIHMADNVALLAKELNVPYLINLSSTAVYPNIDGEYDEESTIWPAANTDCLYGLSKFNAENVLSYRLRNVVGHLLHLRVAMIHGEGMNASRIIPVLVEEIRDKNAITIFGNGERILNLVHVDNLTKYILNYIAFPVSGVINVSDQQISLRELAENLSAKYGNAQTKIYIEQQGSKSKFRVVTEKLQKSSKGIL